MKSISWGHWDPKADACITDCGGGGKPLWLAPIESPLTRAISRGMDLPKVCEADPSAGSLVLDQLVNEVAQQIKIAISNGAQGIAFVLNGAFPEQTTPMQYGGLFLERDRELLALAMDLQFNLIFVEGNSEVYLDTVSDLPAHALGWRIQETGFTPTMMSANRPGPYASFDGLGDITLLPTSNGGNEVAA